MNNKNYVNKTKTNKPNKYESADDAFEQFKETEDIKEVSSFDEMGLKDDILMGICTCGWDNPSPIQRKGIPALLNDSDVIAQAQSGTGKTGTFSISLLNKIENTNKLQGLIVGPTRELAGQIYEVITTLAVRTKISICLCIGGLPVKQNIDMIQKNAPQIIVCTPGRINDLIENYDLKTENIKYLVIDEADDMLSRGFAEQIKKIIMSLSDKAKIALFSATMPIETQEISKKFMNNPINIIIKQEQLTLEGIKQYYVALDNENFKFDTLHDLYSHISKGQAIIYSNERRRVDFMVNKFNSLGHAVAGIHSGVHFKDRQEIMKSFKSGNSRILITTDLLARGIDVQQVSLVINYDMPLTRENYIHRIGRSGRFGRKGVAINIVSPQDREMFEEIERFYRTQIEELPNDVSNIYV